MLVELRLCEDVDEDAVQRTESELSVAKDKDAIPAKSETTDKIS